MFILHAYRLQLRSNAVLRLVLAVALTAAGATSTAGPIADAIMVRRAARVEARELADHGGETGGIVNLPAGARVERDLSYGPDAAQRLDLYMPAGAKAAPIVFMVHGGAWMVGSKSASKVVANKVAHWLPKGYLLVSIDYRMSRSPRVLDQVDDIARALAFVQSTAPSWGGDPARVIVMGHSAGAHLVSMIAADPKLAAAHGARPWLGTISLDSAAFDVSQIMAGKHYGLYDRVFGSDPAYWAQTSPYQRLTAAPLAPMLLVCSTKRSDSCPQAQAFADKANGMGGQVSVFPVDLKHSDVNGDLGVDGDYTRKIDDFMKWVRA